MSSVSGRETPRLVLMLLPAGIVLAAFLLVPLVRLAVAGASGPDGIAAYF